MQRGVLELCLIIIVVIGIHAERILHNGSIVGKITPAKQVSSVTAVKGKDSIKVLSADGRFDMELRPGDWTLIFAGQELNTPLTEKKVQIREGRRTNLGEIRLTQ